MVIIKGEIGHIMDIINDYAQLGGVTGELEEALVNNFRAKD